MAELTNTDIRETVRERYAAAARAVAEHQGCGCGPVADNASCCGTDTLTTDAGGEQVFGEAMYDRGEVEGVPADAVQASLGCGVPTAVADLHVGETVLDLGAGAGADVLISAGRVGPTGRAIGLDMTDEMLALARANAEQAGVQNAEFVKGYIEDLPLPDASVDVVISNCVINLSGDKQQVLREAARVLRPGGRFAVSDVIADAEMDAATRSDMAQWTGCIAGALTEAEFAGALTAAGLVDIEIRQTHRVHEHAGSAIIRAREARMSDGDIQLNDPQTLYRRWEDSQWNPFEIDLSKDIAQWQRADDRQRGLLHFVLASLMVAEERITTKFSGLVGAHGSEEEATFLATQQVDEARHMQFYARFQDEVVADPATIAVHVARARVSVSDAFRQIFDVALVEAHEQLVLAPEDLDAKVRFITIYHLVLEATLGLTTFKFSTDYLNREGLLSGFVEGYSKIHHDETRHIGYGVWYLRETVRERAEMGEVVRATLRELLPSVAESLRPPTDGVGVLGVSEDDLRTFALDGLTRRLKIIGVPLESVFA